MNGATASRMLKTAERVRDLTIAYSTAISRELEINGLWHPAAGATGAERQQRFRAALDELVDEQMNQTKLEQAGELV